MLKCEMRELQSVNVNPLATGGNKTFSRKFPLSCVGLISERGQKVGLGVLVEVCAGFHSC